MLCYFLLIYTLKVTNRTSFAEQLLLMLLKERPRKKSFDEVSSVLLGER